MREDDKKNPNEAMDRAARDSQSATAWNRELARRVARWKRFRLSLAAALASAGLVSLAVGSTAIWAVPCFVAALLVYLLYLDSRDQLRDVQSRRWRTITPRIALSAASSKPADSADVAR